MDRRSGDTQCSLWCHTCFLGPFDRRRNVADVIQAIEDTGNVHTLSMLDTVHHCTHVVRHRIHTQRIQATVEHVGLDACFIERLAEGTHCIVWILTGQKLHLLKSTAIGLHTGETSHVNDDRSDTLQLILAWLELT